MVNGCVMSAGPINGITSTRGPHSHVRPFYRHTRGTVAPTNTTDSFDTADRANDRVDGLPTCLPHGIQTTRRSFFNARNLLARATHVSAFTWAQHMVRTWPARRFAVSVAVEASTSAFGSAHSSADPSISQSLAREQLLQLLKCMSDYGIALR